MHCVYYLTPKYNLPQCMLLTQKRQSAIFITFRTVRKHVHIQLHVLVHGTRTHTNTCTCTITCLCMLTCMNTCTFMYCTCTCVYYVGLYIYICLHVCVQFIGLIIIMVLGLWYRHMYVYAKDFVYTYLCINILCAIFNIRINTMDRETSKGALAVCVRKQQCIHEE
jgi:hypothetical protein